MCFVHVLNKLCSVLEKNNCSRFKILNNFSAYDNTIMSKFKNRKSQNHFVCTNRVSLEKNIHINFTVYRSPSQRLYYSL